MKLIDSNGIHGIVNRAHGSIFSYQGWPTVARDENGVLYAVASGFRVSHICPFGKTVMYISRDGGTTWTPPVVINDTYLDDRDVGILYMGNGRMLVTWFTHSAYAYQTRWHDSIERRAEPAAADAVMGMLKGYDHIPEEERLAGSYVRVSEDYGVTWSEPILLPVTAPHGPTMAKDGTLYYLGLKIYDDDRIHLSEARFGNSAASLYVSRDGGYTWEHRSTIKAPTWLAEGEWLDEPHVLELSNGRILGAFRVEGRKPFTIATAFSDDGGYTWSEVMPTGVSGSPPHLLQHSSGAVICSFGRREDPCGERAMISYDGGESWTDEYVLDEEAAKHGGDLGYPSTVELDDGSLFTVYYQRYGDDAKTSSLYTKWTLKK